MQGLEWERTKIARPSTSLNGYESLRGNGRSPWEHASLTVLEHRADDGPNLIHDISGSRPSSNVGRRQAGIAMAMRLG